jgi:2OG-Fe(II) oxygenase superfamily
MSFSPGENNRVGMAYYRAVGKTPLFSTEECNEVVHWVAAKPFVTRNETRTFPNRAEFGIRRHKEFPISPATRHPAIVAFRQKLERIVGDLNREVWRFDIAGLTMITIIRYDVGDQITLHTDLQSNACDLKLGVFLQLSPSEAYEGGVYEYGVSPPAPLSREQGTLLVLPAWVAHKVTPITAGTRYTAVCFAVGPSFR